MDTSCDLCSCGLVRQRWLFSRTTRSLMRDLCLVPCSTGVGLSRSKGPTQTKGLSLRQSRDIDSEADSEADRDVTVSSPQKVFRRQAKGRRRKSQNLKGMSGDGFTDLELKLCSPYTREEAVRVPEYKMLCKELNETVSFVGARTTLRSHDHPSRDSGTSESFNVHFHTTQTQIPAPKRSRLSFRHRMATDQTPFAHPCDAKGDVGRGEVEYRGSVFRSPTRRPSESDATLFTDRFQSRRLLLSPESKVIVVSALRFLIPLRSGL